jgi:hypothetical protein
MSRSIGKHKTSWTSNQLGEREDELCESITHIGDPSSGEMSNVRPRWDGKSSKNAGETKARGGKREMCNKSFNLRVFSLFFLARALFFFSFLPLPVPLEPFICIKTRRLCLTFLLAEFFRLFFRLHSFTCSPVEELNNCSTWKWLR